MAKKTNVGDQPSLANWKPTPNDWSPVKSNKTMSPKKQIPNKVKSVTMKPKKKMMPMPNKQTPINYNTKKMKGLLAGAANKVFNA